MMRLPHLALAFCLVAVGLSTAAKAEAPSQDCEEDQVATVTATVTEVIGGSARVTDVTGDCFVTEIFTGSYSRMDCKVGDKVTATGEFADNYGSEDPAIYDSKYSCASSK